MVDVQHMVLMPPKGINGWAEPYSCPEKGQQIRLLFPPNSICSIERNVSMFYQQKLHKNKKNHQGIKGLYNMTLTAEMYHDIWQPDIRRG